MSKLPPVADVIEIAISLQEWIEARDLESHVPIVRIIWAMHEIELTVDKHVVWSSNGEYALSFDVCKEEFLSYVWNLQPFFSELRELFG